MNRDPLTLGNKGEKKAVLYLQGLGFTILSKNFHSKFGEIDIIAKDSDCVVFVEVKSRSGFGFGAPLEAISRTKLSKMLKTAQIFLATRHLEEASYRFDAIEILTDNENNFSINHLKNITQ